MPQRRQVGLSGLTAINARKLQSSLRPQLDASATSQAGKPDLPFL